LEHEAPLTSEIPFDYKRKYHGTTHKETTEHFMTVVGAPEIVLELSTSIWQAPTDRDGEENMEMTEQDRIALESVFTDMSKRGLRVLALAKKEDVPAKTEPEEVKELSFVGFVGMKDSLRLEVKEATRRSLEAGIKVVMITGDHKITARAVASEALIYRTGDKSLSGIEIDKMSEKTLREELSGTTVFARVTPEHKFRIINAYKANGEIVAMTGDGVNDAPSLVAADLGVAMGKIGTEVAKEASDIILLDDNFGSIVSAVEEGRSIYKTITKVVLYLISTSIGEVLVIVAAILLGWPLPLLAAQIIWLNFITDGFFIPALAMEPREVGLLRGNFKRPGKYLIDKLSAQRMFLMSITMMIFTLILFSFYYENELAKAWTVSLTILAVFQWFNAWNCRSEKESIFKMNPWSNKWLIAGTIAAFAFQLLAVYHPFFQKFLRTTALDLSEWLVIVSFAASIVLVEEMRKFIWRHKKSWSSSAPQLQASQT
jgi:Ca2+-transporting ATPase